MRKFLLLTLFHWLSIHANGQATIRSNLSQREVNDLLKLSQKTPDGIDRIVIFLRLAEFYLRKDGDETPDIDSATAYVARAKDIASKISYNNDGVISLFESSLARIKGNTNNGILLANKAINKLKNEHDELHLAVAYLELSLCYDWKQADQAVVIKNIYNVLFQRVAELVKRDQSDSCMLELKTFYILQMRGDDHLKKLDFLDRLGRVYQLHNDKVNEFWTRKEMADIHYQSGKLDVAIRELIQIAKEQREGNYPGISFTYDLLSGLYYAGAQYDKAVYYSLEIIKNIRDRNDSDYLSNFYARIAMSYGANGNPGEAIAWNRKRLDYLLAKNQKAGIYTIIFNVTSDLIKLGRQKEALDLILDKSKSITPEGNEEKRSMFLSLAQCYAAVKNVPMAEAYAQELIKIVDLRMRLKETGADPWAYRFLASFYLGNRQFEKAEMYFKQSLSGLPDLRKGTILLYINNFYFKLDSAKGNYLSAIKYLRIWQSVRDSIFTATKSKQIEELKITYETEQKDSLINLKEQNIQLLTRQDQLQKSKLQQGAILRNISLAVAALLIIIVGLLFNRYRLKQRTNKKLEFQQAEIETQNLSLQHLVNEKDWLLKEIHHRVKNNLQIVMSLLNSQSAYIDNESALTAINDSQHRVHAMSLIHQKLYNADNLSSIDMSIYIRELVSYLADSFDTQQRIHFEFVIDPLEMDVSQAVPLGLILNEAITNSIKYAFPNGRSGTISISLTNISLHRYLLVVSDNGVGMPAHVTKNKPGSLGMSLMEGLSEDLSGDFSIENKAGVTIKISFVHEAGIKRPDHFASSFVSRN